MPVYGLMRYAMRSVCAVPALIWANWLEGGSSVTSYVTFRNLFEYMIDYNYNPGGTGLIPGKIYKL